MWCRKRLVHVDVQTVETHLSRLHNAQNRVQVGAVAVHQPSGAVHGRGHFLQMLLEQPERARIGQHQPDHRLVELCLEPRQVDVALRIGGDRNADKILTALRHAPNGLTKTEISTDVFNRHASSAEIDEALRLLNGLKMVQFKLEATGGAPSQRWSCASENREKSE